MRNNISKFGIVLAAIAFSLTVFTSTASAQDPGVKKDKQEVKKEHKHMKKDTKKEAKETKENKMK